MKIIIGMICLALLATPVLAETNISSWISSNDTVNYWTYCDSPDCSYNLDGQNFPDYVDQKISDTKFNVWDVVNHLEDTAKCALGIKKHCSEWNFRIFNALASMFVTRPEYYDANNNFDIRIAMLEKTMEVSNAENFCKGKISVLIEKNLDWVKCQNVTYYNINGKGIAIQGIE